MNRIKQFVLTNVFSHVTIVTLLIGIFPLIFCNKPDVILFINKNIASNTFDTFFIYFTDTALGHLFVVPIIILLFFNYRKASIIALVGILVLLVSFISKQYLFPSFSRPTAEIDLSNFYHTIAGFEYRKMFSFPSGHTMTAFAFASIMSFLFKNRYVHILLFVYAVGIAFSRMYLLQHFYMDVFAGACIGYSLTLVTIYLIPQFQKIPEKGISPLN